MNKKRTLLVLVGRAVGGKDTVGKYLARKYGFERVVTGQLLRDYISQHKLGEPTRDLLIKVGNKLRTQYGADYLFQQAIKVDADRLIVDGLRAVGEIKSAKAAVAVVIAVDAPMEKRYEWASGRGRTSDQISFKDFARQEKQESNNTSTSAQSIDEVMSMADYVIENNQDLPHLYDKVDALMSQLGIGRL